MKILEAMSLKHVQSENTTAVMLNRKPPRFRAGFLNYHYIQVYFVTVS